MRWLYGGLSIVSHFWWAFLLAWLGLLLWSGFIHPDWQNLRTLRQRRWLKTAAWSLLGLLAVSLVLAWPMRGPK